MYLCASSALMCDHKCLRIESRHQFSLPRPFAPNGHRVSTWPWELVGRFNHSRLTLLHVVSEEHTTEEQCQRLRKQAQDELAALIAERGDVQIAANVRIRGGNPPERIIAFGSKVQAELIILGASAASRTSHLLVRGVVHRVLAEACASVMTVRRDQATMEEQFISAGAGSADPDEN